MKKNNYFLSLYIFFLAASVNAESLNNYIIMALNSHPLINSQKNLIKSSEANRQTAFQQFFPTPSVSYENNMTSGSNRTSPTYQGDTSTLNLSLRQPLWTGGRLIADLNKAEAQIVQSNAALEETRQDITLRVVQAWGEWFAASLKKKAMDRNVGQHQKLKDIVERRFNEGASSESELIFTKSRLDQALNQQETFNIAAENAKIKISQLVGNPNIKEESFVEFHPKYTPAKFQEMLSKIELINPTIKKLEASLKIQEYEIERVKSDLMPEAYLKAEHQQGNLNFRNAPDTDLIFFGISTKFGPGLSNLTRINSAENRRDSINDEIEASKRNILEKFNSDLAQLNSYRQRLPILLSSAEYAKSAAESWERQFFAGKKSWFEVMNATRELSQTEIDLAEFESLLIQTEWRLLILVNGIENTLQSANYLPN